MTSAERQKFTQAIRRAAAVQPDQAWLLSTRQRLSERVAATMPTKPLSWHQGLRLAFDQLVASRVIILGRAPLVVALSALGMIAGGSIASVSAAERSIPGDFLYTVKLAAEQTRLAFTSNKSERLKLKTEFAARRIHEIDTIVASDVSQKPERIKTAADILKQDLDTVKHQLNEVSSQGSASETAQAAKLIDEKSSEFAASLNAVKTTVADNQVRASVAEAQAAAVNTGVKAMQVLVDSSSKPEAQVNKTDLIASLQGKVRGMQANIDDVAKQLLSVNIMVASSSADHLLDAASSSALELWQNHASSSLGEIKNARVSLDQATQLLQQDNLIEVTNRLAQTAQVVGNIESHVDALPAAFTASQASSTIAPAAKHDGTASTSTEAATASSATTAAATAAASTTATTHSGAASSTHPSDRQ